MGHDGHGWVEKADGAWCDVWLYDDLVTPLMMLSAAVGFENISFGSRPSTGPRRARGSSTNGWPTWTWTTSTRRSAFPNTLPRFCGQTFLERADKELGLLCVQAYNDWMIDEWSAATATAG